MDNIQNFDFYPGNVTKLNFRKKIPKWSVTPDCNRLEPTETGPRRNYSKLQSGQNHIKMLHQKISRNDPGIPPPDPDRHFIDPEKKHFPRTQRMWLDAERRKMRRKGSKSGTCLVPSDFLFWFGICHHE